MAKSDAHPVVVECVRILRERGQTIAFAESCSGGVLSAIFTRQPGVSDVFTGSIVSYANRIKEDWLGVPKSLLLSVGAVSLPVAKKMAEGARLRMGVTWAIAITGIAGPSGGSEQKPVGSVCIAIEGPGVERLFERRFSGTRREVQVRSAGFALRALLRELSSSDSPGQLIKKRTLGKKKR